MKARCILVLVSSILAVGVIFSVASTYAPWPVSTFPTLRDTYTGGYAPQKLTGRLVVHGGAIRLRSPFPAFGFLLGTSELLIWPAGYSVSTDDSRTVIRDRDGQIVARVGDFVALGGARISAAHTEYLLGRPLPENWHGPYAIVVPLNP